MDEQLAELVDTLVPLVEADGGTMALVSADRDAGIVTLRLGGECIGCSGGASTMKVGIERIMKDRLSWLSEVRHVDDGSETAVTL